MQAITQCARIVYTKPVEIRMPHIVGATLAAALMQGGASPVPAVFPGNACGVQKGNCTFVARFPAKPLNDAQTGGQEKGKKKSVFLVDNTEGNHYLCTSKR